MHHNPLQEWMLSIMDYIKPQGENMTATTIQSADVQAYEKDLVDRAVRYARDNELCEAFTEAFEELFPGVAAVDSDGVDCDGNTVRFLNGNGVDAAKVKAETIASIVDKAVRLARQYPHVVSADHARVAFNAVFPGVRIADSDGRGL